MNQYSQSAFLTRLFFLASSSPFVYIQGLVRSEELCPKLTINVSNAERRIISGNGSIPVKQIPLGHRSIAKEIHDGNSECKFAVNFHGYHSPVNEVVIKAAQVTLLPWDFSESGRCQFYMKFLVTNTRISEEKKHCIIQQWHKVERNGMHHLPSIWLLPRMQIGIHTKESAMESPNDNKTHFLNIVLQYQLPDSCILQVQQFKRELNCNKSTAKEQICGTYKCQQRPTLWKQLGFEPDPEPLEQHSKSHPAQNRSVIKKEIKYQAESNKLKTFAFILLGSTISGSIYAAFRLLCCSNDTGRNNGQVSRRKESNQSSLSLPAQNTEAEHLRSVVSNGDSHHIRTTEGPNIRIDKDDSTVDGSLF